MAWDEERYVVLQLLTIIEKYIFLLMVLLHPISNILTNLQAFPFS